LYTEVQKVRGWEGQYGEVMLKLRGKVFAVLLIDITLVSRCIRGNRARARALNEDEPILLDEVLDGDRQVVLRRSRIVAHGFLVIGQEATLRVEVRCRHDGRVESV
jgi:dTDP-4-dehydrorhamnose 3,5-epimerase-like enzyme